MPRIILSRILCALFVLLLIGTLLAAAVPLSSEPNTGQNGEPTPDRVAKRQNTREIPEDLFRNQLRNPKEMLSILLLIGGDVIQRAVAQLSGPRGRWFTPLIFSFGWVTYAFSTVASAIGDGTFLPPPDYPGVVVNVKSGDIRKNQSWVLGRLCRDLELEVETREGPDRSNTGLLVSVLRARPVAPRDPGAPGGYKSCEPRRDWVWWCFVPFVLIQGGIASIPFILYGNWSILLVTLIGNLLAVLSGSLRAMRQEKYACFRHSAQSFVLTRGNGHRHVFLLLPDTFDKRSGGEALANLPAIDMLASASHRAGWRTRALIIIVAGLWVAFLVVVGGLEADTWYLLAAGLCGMVHNLVCSGWTRTSEAHGIPLEFYRPPGGGGGFSGEQIFGVNEMGTKEGRRRVLDVLVELEVAYPGAGHSLKDLFFTGRATEGDKQKWEAKNVPENTVDQRYEVWRKQCKKTVGPLESRGCLCGNPACLCLSTTGTGTAGGNTAGIAGGNTGTGTTGRNTVQVGAAGGNTAGTGAAGVSQPTTGMPQLARRNTAPALATI